MSAVSGANDLTGFHFCLSQSLAVVSATVFYSVDLYAAAYDDDRDAVDFCGEGCRLMDGIASADVNPLRGHDPYLETGLLSAGKNHAFCRRAQVC
jgi:hypothetical protein